MHRVYRISTLQSLTNKDISRLETIANKKFNLVQKILLVDLGNTQQLLEVIYNTETRVRVISQIEKKGVIARKSTIHSSTNKILVYANSKINCKYLPSKILTQIRECKIGIGKILLYHKVDIFKNITEIGYVPKVHIFKNYSLYHNDNLICTITEIFPFRIIKSV
jgi:chorismate-pyruvate lyase